MLREHKTIGQQRMDRLIAANELIRVIANCGRRFFRNTGCGHDAYLTLNARRNIVWLFDDFTYARISLAKKDRWDGVSHGGTMKSLVSSVGTFIPNGSTMRYGYFQTTMSKGFEKPCGYGEDILIVRNEGVRLGLIRRPLEEVIAS